LIILRITLICSKAFFQKKSQIFILKNYFQKKNYDTIFLFNSLDQNFVQIQPKKSLITMDLGYNLGVSTLIAFVFSSVGGGGSVFT
jgi:hypothetical protein